MEPIEQFFNAMRQHQLAEQRAYQEPLQRALAGLDEAVNRTMMIRLAEQQQQIKQLEAIAREAVELAQERTQDVADLTATIEALVTREGARPAHRPGTPLSHIVRDGVSRDFESEQIIAEAAALGFVIDDSLVNMVREDFNARMQADLCGGPELRAVLEQALTALKEAQKHHSATSLPLAYQICGSRESMMAAGLNTWRDLVPGAINALTAALDEPKKGVIDMVEFSTEDKLAGVIRFIKTMNATAGCSATELKQLLDPRIIDEILNEPQKVPVEGEAEIRTLAANFIAAVDVLSEAERRSTWTGEFLNRSVMSRLAAGEEYLKARAALEAAIKDTRA